MAQMSFLVDHAGALLCHSPSVRAANAFHPEYSLRRSNPLRSARHILIAAASLLALSSHARAQGSARIGQPPMSTIARFEGRWTMDVALSPSPPPGLDALTFIISVQGDSMVMQVASRTARGAETTYRVHPFDGSARKGTFGPAEVPFKLAWRESTLLINGVGELNGEHVEQRSEYTVSDSGSTLTLRRLTVIGDQSQEAMVVLKRE